MSGIIKTSSLQAVAGRQGHISEKVTKKQLLSANPSQRYTFGHAYFEDPDNERSIPKTPGLFWDSDTSTPPISPIPRSVFEDWDDFGSHVEIDDEGAQIITIPADSHFHRPPPSCPPFNFAPFSDPSFPSSSRSVNAEKPKLSLVLDMKWEMGAITPVQGEPAVVINGEIVGMTRGVTIQKAHYPHHDLFESFLSPLDVNNANSPFREESAISIGLSPNSMV